MKRILVINNKYNRGYIYNVVKPLIKLQETCNDIHITIKSGCDVKHITHSDYDYVIFNKDIYEDFYNVIVDTNKTKFVFYIDEWWQLPKTHHMYKVFNSKEINQKYSQTIRKSDLILTYGNDILVEEIKKFNKNVVRIKRTEGYTNIGVDTNIPVFGVVPTEHDLLNIHQLSKLNFSNLFWENNKIVLVGFTNIVSKYDNIERCHIDTEFNGGVWYEYEKIITNNYKLCSEGYKKFLLNFIPNSHYKGDINAEPYKRIWKNEIDDDTIYYNILLKPLIKNKNNLLLYDIETDLATNTIIDNKYVQVLNTIYYPKLNIEKNIKKNMGEMAMEYRQKSMFPIEKQSDETLNIILNIFK